MSTQSKNFVMVTEVGTRDGFQAEPEFIATANKVATINGLIDAGVRSIEATSFVSPRALPQLADAAEVLACSDTVRTTRSAGNPNLRTVASMMRALA